MSDEDDETSCTSPASAAVAADKLNLTPGSREMYERVYNRFSTWAKEQEVQDFTENVVLAYFTHLSKTLSSSSMWAHFSILKAQLDIKNNVNIGCYKRVKVFLKRKSENFTAKKTKTFTDNQVDTFLTEAPDKKYLAMKVVLIFGISGACRCNELLWLRVQDIEFLEKIILVKIRKSDNSKPRSFAIDDDYYIKICKKYLSLRPEGMQTDRFFIRYQNGACHRAVMGKHKISSIPKEVALFLKLPDAKEYTGLCLRQSYATIQVYNGSLKRHGSSSSTTVEDDSLRNIVVKIEEGIEDTNEPEMSTMDHDV